MPWDAVGHMSLLQKRWAGIAWTEANNFRLIQPAHPTIFSF